MNAFMGDHFLLDTSAAVELYRNYAASCPIFDYHNHLSAGDIANRRRFANLTELWLEGDHYKWRAMRACGVDEAYITGKEIGDYEKFLAWAEVLPQLVGCPLYHWAHLELQRYFNISQPLTPQTAPEIWGKTCDMLSNPGFDTENLLRKQNVKVLCTTDDPADSLDDHLRIAREGTFPFRVLPSFRPDRYLQPESEGFRRAVAELAGREVIEINSMDALKRALARALDRFVLAGCRTSDHGISCFIYGSGNGDAALQKALQGQPLTLQEVADYRGDLLRFLGEAYYRRSIVMQIHIGAMRDVNPSLYHQIGVAAGGDSVGPVTDPYAIAAFLGDLEAMKVLPNTVLYNANPADNIVLSTMAADFAPVVQYGAAWWFNDTLRGINNQLDELMETGQLAQSIGMLTDSRSFTSFPRHEYFRRILCARIGRLMESGAYHHDMAQAGTLVQNICYRNAQKFFGF